MGQDVILSGAKDLLADRVIPSVERGIWVGAFLTRRGKGPAAQIPRSTLGMTHRLF